MKSPLPYIGGKSKLAHEITRIIPSHTTYCEVFAGAGWVFFTKDPSKYEVINDLDGELITFYRVLQNHLEEFLRQFKWLLASREMFEDFKSQLDSRGLTDIQKAARYYYLQRQTFGGKVLTRSFGVDPAGPPAINLLRMEEELSAVHLRMARVTIENLDWKDFVGRYDREETFFYLDPPYYSAPCYKHNFKEISDYADMADTLKGIKGKFLLSINDHLEIREVFKDFNMRPVELTYSVKKEDTTLGRELLVSNYEMNKGQLNIFEEE